MYRYRYIVIPLYTPIHTIHTNTPLYTYLSLLVECIALLIAPWPEVLRGCDIGSPGQVAHQPNCRPQTTCLHMTCMYIYGGGVYRRVAGIYAQCSIMVIGVRRSVNIMVVGVGRSVESRREIYS